MAIPSSLGIRTINDRVRSLGIAVTRVKKSSFLSSKILMNKTKIKRSSLFEGRRLFQRKKESVRFKDQESIIEASKLVAPVKKGAAFIARSTKGFLGRLLDFSATLLTGWLLYNLPTIIAMAKELMGRITRMVQLLKGFVSNIGNTMRGFGNLLGAVFQNITSFDFLDTSKRVDKAMKDLTGTFDDMGAQIDEGIRLLTTSLGEGLVTGENAPPTGTQYPAQPEAGAPTPSRGGFGGSGISKGTQIARRLQKDLGLKDYQAAAVVGNLLNESSQLNPAQLENSGSGLLTEAMRKGTGYGWAQWTDAGRQRKLYQLAQSMGIDPSKQPLTDEVNYAMLVSELPQYDSGGRFRASKNITEASNWLLEQYFRPADRGPREQRERIAEGQKVLQGIKTTSTPATPSASQTSQPSIPQSPVKPITPILTSRMGERRKGGRIHGGTDLATNAGTPLRAVSDGIIVDSGVNPGGWGNFIVIKDNQNIYHLYGHIQDGYKKGGSVKQGEVVAKVGTTGRVTGPHLHWETGTGWNGYVLSGKFDPLNRYSKFAPFNTTSSAQIAAQPQQRRQQLPSQITPERKGQQIVLIDDIQPPPPPMPTGGGGGGMIPIVINPLNSYITNKLLLDLAYT